MHNFFTKFIRAFEVLAVQELFFALSEEYVADICDKFQINPRGYFSAVNFRCS